MLSTASPKLAVRTPDAVPTAALASPGYAWWYLDLLNDDGDGVVIIASFGLPFLPGLASSDRAGEPKLAARRASLNVAVYRGHRRCAYVLQELPEHVCAWNDGHIELGQTSLRSVDTQGQRTLKVELDCPLPGTDTRLTGHIELRGVAPTVRGHEEGPHGWAVRGVGPSTGHIRAGSRTLLEVEGRGYHDTNWSSLPLHRLDMDRWLWARIAGPLGDRVLWMLWPEDGGDPVTRYFHVSDQLIEEDCEVQIHGSRRGLFGLRAPRRIEVETDRERATIHLDHLVDDGFFYQRFATSVTLGGRRVPGTAELVHPHRVDLNRHRALVRMAHHDLTGRNSMWLPLFCGTQHDRLPRLLRWWWRRATTRPDLLGVH
ncbi:MAG: carotenoid 1,2-hydratase [Kiritimatiellia bacterium]